MAMIFPDPKGPTEVLDYLVNWTAALEGDPIVGSTWTLPSGLTTSQNSFTSSTTTVWIGGGSGGTYDLVNTITTTAGRVLVRTVQLKVADL